MQKVNDGWVVVFIYGAYSTANSVGENQHTVPNGQSYKEQTNYSAFAAGPCCIRLHEDVAAV